MDSVADYIVCAICKLSWMKRTIPIDHWVCPSCRGDVVAKQTA